MLFVKNKNRFQFQSRLYMKLICGISNKNESDNYYDKTHSTFCTQQMTQSNKISNLIDYKLLKEQNSFIKPNKLN